MGVPLELTGSQPMPSVYQRHPDGGYEPQQVHSAGIPLSILRGYREELTAAQANPYMRAEWDLRDLRDLPGYDEMEAPLMTPPEGVPVSAVHSFLED